MYYVHTIVKSPFADHSCSIFPSVPTYGVILYGPYGLIEIFLVAEYVLASGRIIIHIIFGTLCTYLFLYV